MKYLKSTLNLTEILEETDRIPTSGDAACAVAGMSNSFYTQVDGSVKLHDKCNFSQIRVFDGLVLAPGP